MDILSRPWNGLIAATLEGAGTLRFSELPGPTGGDGDRIALRAPRNLSQGLIRWAGSPRSASQGGLRTDRDRPRFSRRVSAVRYYYGRKAAQALIRAISVDISFFQARSENSRRQPTPATAGTDSR